jgi:AcrR family transcriptional regulator
MARTPQPLEPAREGDLVLTAARHFAAAGYAGTSLNTVIMEAGWGKSSFYHYFDNKRRLHDHVVRTLTSRLADGVQVPDTARLSSADFWPAMADLLDGFVRAARQHPETSYLGEMFHRPATEDDGLLQELREQVQRWLRRAVIRGRRLGVVRDDLPERLLIELTLTTLQTLDRWAVRHKLVASRGAEPALFLQLVRDLIEQRGPVR